MWNPSALIILAVFISVPPSLGDLTDVTELLSLGGDIVEKIFQTWSILSPEGDRWEGQDGPGEYLGPEFSFTRKKERKLLARMSELSRLVSRVEHAVQASTEATVNVLMKNLPDVLKLELRLDHLTECMAGVSDKEQVLAEYIRLGYDNSSELEGSVKQSSWLLEKHTLLDFAEHAVSHDTSSVRGYMSKINSLVAPQSGPFRKSVLLLLKDALKQQGNGLLCGANQSPQQLLMNLFSSIQLVQLQGFAVMQFSWMLLRLYDKGNFSLEAKIAAQQFKRNQENQVSVIRGVLKGASRAVWRCDPDQHVEGKTYEQVTRLLQGFLVNEVDLNSDASCKENCAFYSYAETNGCYQDQYCSKQPRCHGHLLNCQFFDADMWVCPASGANTSLRRYNWIEFESGKVLGRKGYCPTGTTKVDSWWRWFVHCSYCMCLCDEEGPLSDRYFSLRPVVSDVANNKVVTGVKIVKYDRIFYIQIEQGEVQKNGAIDSSALDWKPIDSFSLYGAQIQNGKDFFKMNWDQRAVDMDDLVPAPGHALTGLAFRVLGGHLNLVIRTTPIDIKTGKLRPDASVWLDNDNTAGSTSPRKELLLWKPDVPTESLAPSVPDSKPDMYLKFTNSDMEVDVAQTTVPFIDIQAVVPNPPILLSGAGLYHKGQPGYGGFIALKVFTYDFSDHVTPILPNADAVPIGQEYHIEQSN